MSLLSAVLQVADENHRKELKLQFKDVNKRTSIFVDKVKNFTIDVKEILVSRFVDYIPIKSLEYIKFSDRRKKLQAEYEELQTLVDTLTNTSAASNVHFRALYDDFCMTSNRFKLMSDLAKCSKDLESANRLIERRRYKEASEQLETPLEILNQSIPYNDLTELVESMKDIISMKHVRCLNNIIELWRERLSWSHNATDKGKVISVKIDISENLNEVLNALSSSKRVNVELVRFADFLVKTVFPVLTTKKCNITVTSTLNTSLMEIEYNKDKNTNIQTILSNTMKVFDNIQSNIDYKWEDDRTVFSILGQIASKEFFKILKDNCFDKLIPTEESMIDEYHLIAVEIENFSSYLREIRFIEEHSSLLSEYTKDIHSLIFDKKCQKLLSDARAYMKTSLQENTVEVSVNESSELCVDEMKLLRDNICHDRIITESPFLLPQCRVSESAKKILELIVYQLELAAKSPKILASKIVICVRNIFEMYYTLVPNYHEDVLKNNAMDLALFYNNCFYLAHGMLGHPWSKIFSSTFSESICAVLADQAHNMRLAAIIRMSTFIRGQRQLIKDTITKSELGSLEKVETIGPSATEAVLSCLEKFEKLKVLWKPILPTVTYEKTMNNLISCLSEELVEVVMMVKDKVIGETMAKELSVVYQAIVERVPQLFDEGMEPEKISKQWSRLVEFTLLLDSPIFAIASSWSKKNGRLAKLFKCEEIKHFVRIIYPANKQKSTVLNIIE